MVKKQLKEEPTKSCYGTKEWSVNSGICAGCKLKESCGKIKAKKDNF